jgi:hypothetical protein
MTRSEDLWASRGQAETLAPPSVPGVNRIGEEHNPWAVAGRPGQREATGNGPAMSALGPVSWVMDGVA